MHFIKFDVENQVSCNYDYVVTGSRRYCGKRLPPMLKLLGGNTTFKFHSDGNTRKPGFILQIGK